MKYILPNNSNHVRINYAALDPRFKKLSPMEQHLIRLRYGLFYGAQSLEKVSKIFGLTRERIRQIQAQALNKIKSTKKFRRLKDYLGSVDLESNFTGRIMANQRSR